MKKGKTKRVNVENKRDDSKKENSGNCRRNFVYCSFAFIVMQIMLPETGIGGMVNEGSMAVYFSE